MHSIINHDRESDYHMLLSRITHEIRNPLALLDSQFQLLREHYPELDTAAELESIYSTLDYLSDLLSELSDYNYASQFHPEPVDISDFLEELISGIRPHLEYLDISLTLRVSPALPSIMLDKTRIRQAFLNLLQNAKESILPPGEILVEAFAQQEFLYLTVTDNGSGIPEEYLDTLFEPFVTHKSEGTGLGLSIVRQVMDTHGGDIQVKSVRGQGTSFSLIFPITT